MNGRAAIDPKEHFDVEAAASKYHDGWFTERLSVDGRVAFPCAKSPTHDVVRAYVFGRRALGQCLRRNHWEKALVVVLSPPQIIDLLAKLREELHLPIQVSRF